VLFLVQLIVPLTFSLLADPHPQCVRSLPSGVPGMMLSMIMPIMALMAIPVGPTAVIRVKFVKTVSKGHV